MLIGLYLLETVKTRQLNASVYFTEQIAMWGELCYTYFMLLCKRNDAQTLNLRNNK